MKKDLRCFAFNIWDFDSICAVIDAAGDCGCDVILQTSSRVFEAMEKVPIRDFVRYYSKKANVNAYLHLDHCRKLGVLYQAVDSGWDSVMLDASCLPLAENIRLTNQAAKYAHSAGVSVEAEVGQIFGTENDIVCKTDAVADPASIQHFLAKTNIDFLAAAIGTAHGLYKREPHIHYDLIEKIGQMTNIPFVIHGGSGLPDETLKKLLAYPFIRKINISTELKQAYRRGIQTAISEGYLQSEGFEVSPVKSRIYQAIYHVAAEKMKLLRDS